MTTDTGTSVERLRETLAHRWHIELACFHGDPDLGYLCLRMADTQITDLAEDGIALPALLEVVRAGVAMFAQEFGVCVECGWVGDHGSDLDAEAARCLSLPLRTALAALGPVR